MRLASWSNCTFVVTPVGIFNASLTFFFFFVVTPCYPSAFVRVEISLRPYLYGARYSPRPSIARLWRCSSSSRRRAVLPRQPLHRSRIRARSTSVESAIHRVSLLEISVFSSSFSLSSYPYRFSSWLSSPLRLLWRRVSQWDRYSESTLCRARGTLREFIPWSPR